MSRSDPLLPAHEGLRRALDWLAEQEHRDAGTIEQAAQRFDLSPADEDFLFRHFLRGADPVK